MNKIIIFLFIITITLIILIYYAGNYLYNLAINPKYPKDLIFKSKTNENTKQEETSGISNLDAKTWLLKFSKFEDLFIKSKDNLNLHNYLIKNKNNSNKWAIIIHGYNSKGIYMGYNIIIPDLRGHGKSEGNYIGMGWHERYDILDLSNYIANTYNNSQIVLFGVSMGASTVMSTSGETLPKNVKAIIEDCGYTSTWNQFSYQLKSLFKLPPFPLMHIASIICKLKSGYFISEASPIKQIKKSITPTLFIHGDKDDFVPFFMLDELYNASTVEKEKLIINGASHAKASYVNPKLYWSTIENFLNKYIK